MKGPSRKEDFSKKKAPPAPQSFDEAKASCKARKRKERQESISSLCQERKVIRSNSEERPIQKKHFENNKSSIRRVSSSEDFQKSETTKIEKKAHSPVRQPDIVLIYDADCENEKRRTHERFLKPMIVKNKKPHKKPKPRCLAKPKFKPESAAKPEEVDIKLDPFLQLDKERSPSPVRQFSQEIDLNNLHNSSEPLLSCSNDEINEDTETLPGLSVASSRLLSSPRNSIIATHRIYLDPDIQQANFGLETQRENAMDARLQKITKQINSVKKKIKKYEMEFEAKHGYKVSHADKLNDKNIKKSYLELSKLKKDQKQIIEVGPGKALKKEVGHEIEKGATFHNTILEIEKRLTQKRDSTHRSALVEQMTYEELSEEKIAVQKALLYLESVHGRPDSKDQRNLARPIYERYRLLKRLLGKTQSNQVGNELATIHEDETMNFVPSFTPQLSEMDSERSSAFGTSTESSDTETSSSISENLHALTRNELIAQQKLVGEEKKDLRRSIKLFELDFLHRNGRMVQKDDRGDMEEVYGRYKRAKAKLKLLDALLGKQM